MADNPYVNKVTFDGEVLMDITDTTAEEEDVIGGQVFYTRSGARAVGTLGDATTENHGLMSAADKAKLDQFQDASNYITEHQDISGKIDAADLATVATSGSYNDLSDKPFIPNAVSDLIDDSGHYTKPANGIPAADLEETYLTSFTETDPTVPSWAKAAQKPTYTAQEVGALPANTYIPNKTSDLVNDSNYPVDANYVHTDNNYTTEEKSKLAGIAAGAEVNVNADWNATIGDAAILNKPTKVSDFQNDTGFITSAALPTKVSELQNDSGYLTQHQDISGKANSVDLATVATSGAYSDLSGTPTNVSNFTNDVGYLTTHQDISNYVQKTDLADANNTGVVKVNTSYGIGIQASGDNEGTLTLMLAGPSAVKGGTTQYRALAPLTQHLATFYGLAKAAGHDEKDEPNNNFGTYSAEAKAAIQTMLDVPSNATVTSAISTAIGNVHQFDIQVVQALPTQNIQEHTVYFVPKTGETNDIYDEYIYVNNDWEMIGNTQIDLSNYATKNEIPNVPVQDVQVNGTSILNNNVANIPLADANNAGVVRISASGGLAWDINGYYLRTTKATPAQIKEGINEYRPIVPSNQNLSVFYGLAKAAGDTTQASSSNAVGTYTTEAKAAIRTMLGGRRKFRYSECTSLGCTS